MQKFSPKGLNGLTEKHTRTLRQIVNKDYLLLNAESPNLGACRSGEELNLNTLPNSVLELPFLPYYNVKYSIDNITM
ncbi:7933_t:CDS:2 [Racocetra persica]|uniref:7933_t:CDS:1 n=1 Tax=Racocetra persica TaxID=160502 RepID=A0ACA9KDC3_9GLOM|nr:7933_t:CDS:2 [Racocetra persica]